MAISLLPALLEVLKLLLWLGAGVAMVQGFVWLNYKTWAHVLYLPACTALGLGAAYWVNTEWHADFLKTCISALVPLCSAAFFRFALQGRYKSPIYFAAPALAGVLLLFFYPLAFEVYLSFQSLNLESLGSWIRTGEVAFAGLNNYEAVFSFGAQPGQGTWEVLRENFLRILSTGSGTRDSFWKIMNRTFLWTAINLVFHVGFGLGLALLLNQKIRFRGVYRTILVLPWAMPQLIAVLAWRGEFHSEYGYINYLLNLLNGIFTFPGVGGDFQPLAALGLHSRAWLTDPASLFAAVCIVNIWLGIPFMMVVSLSALQSIPVSLYEAARIDGSSRFQQFRYITLPLLRPVMVPSMILGMIWTFNNVNVVYLMTAQRGGSEGADILVSDLYKQWNVLNRYSFSAAYAIVIFAILLVLTAVWLRSSKVAGAPAR